MKQRSACCGIYASLTRREREVIALVIAGLLNKQVGGEAYTSRAFNTDTKELARHSQSGGECLGIHVSHNGTIMICAGGIPLKADGKVAGAIGVSGGSDDQDHALAAAGAAAF